MERLRAAPWAAWNSGSVWEELCAIVLPERLGSLGGMPDRYIDKPHLAVDKWTWCQIISQMKKWESVCLQMVVANCACDLFYCWLEQVHTIPVLI